MKFLAANIVSLMLIEAKNGAIKAESWQQKAKKNKRIKLLAEALVRLHRTVTIREDDIEAIIRIIAASKPQAKSDRTKRKNKGSSYILEVVEPIEAELHRVIALTSPDNLRACDSLSLVDLRSLFTAKIKIVHQQLDALKPENLIQSLETFENQFTLYMLEGCLSDSTPENVEANLKDILSQRWERIRRTNLCYTQQPGNAVNQLCLELAKVLAPPASTPSEIESLAPRAGPYFLLMPSLEQSETILGFNIHFYKLHECILSDNERWFIPIADCLKMAYESAEGLFHHLLIGNEHLELTANEIERVSHHSIEAHEFYQAVLAFNHQRLLGGDIGAKLNQLAISLRGGGASSWDRKANELNAGAAASIGIVDFETYWSALSDRQKSHIYTTTPTLEHILGRLFRPTDSNYKETQYCVQLLANDLDPIITKYNANPQMQPLLDRVLQAEAIFNVAAQSYCLAVNQNLKPCAQALSLVYKLSLDQQNPVCKLPYYANTLSYVLGRDKEERNVLDLAIAQYPELIEPILMHLATLPIEEQMESLSNVSGGSYSTVLLYAADKQPHLFEALLERALTLPNKKSICNATQNTQGENALLWAAKLGTHQSIRNILNAGLAVHYLALHYAAYNGDCEAITLLLDSGSSLNALDKNNKTSLAFAVSKGRSAAVKLLLAKRPNVSLRDKEGQNVLDLALELSPEFIEPMLMYIATLPIEEQVECLSKVPGGPFPTVLLYAAEKQPHLFEALLERALTLPNKKSICRAQNKQGENALLWAAKLGTHQSIRNILNAGLAVHYLALHYAAYNGDCEAITLLLDSGSSLNALDKNNKTPLFFALLKRSTDAVKLLLAKRPNLRLRDKEGKNLLDLALELSPEFIAPLLMHIATLPLEEQVECLSKVPGGPFPTVLLYAAEQHPHLFDALLEQVLAKPHKKSICKAQNKQGENALLWAAKLGTHQSIRNILNAGLAAHHVALHYAAYNGDCDAITLLLDSGSPLNAVDASNNTPLFFAVLMGRSDAVKLLLERRANLSFRNNQGDNVLDMAIAKHHEFIEPILMHLATWPLEEQATCLMEISHGKYKNAYEYAVKEHPELFEKLIRDLLMKSNVNLPDSSTKMINQQLHNLLKEFLSARLKQNKNPNYSVVVNALEKLLITYAKAEMTLFQNNRPNLEAFVIDCTHAFAEARPVLTNAPRPFIDRFFSHPPELLLTTLQSALTQLGDTPQYAMHN